MNLRLIPILMHTESYLDVKLVCDYLLCVFFCLLYKMFNSRTCQLILGAGALHLVGLKNINTKNLGLLFVVTVIG